jgi:hypothetical protein
LWLPESLKFVWLWFAASLRFANFFAETDFAGAATFALALAAAVFFELLIRDFFRVGMLFLS